MNKKERKENLTNQVTGLYKTREAAEILNIAYSTLWRWIKKGEIPTVRIGGRNFIKHDTIQSILNGEKQK